jgi:hypothetical protein
MVTESLMGTEKDAPTATESLMETEKDAPMATESPTGTEKDAPMATENHMEMEKDATTMTIVREVRAKATAANPALKVLLANLTPKRTVSIKNPARASKG